MEFYFRRSVRARGKRRIVLERERERERFSVVFFCILTTYTTKAKTNKQRINKEGELHFNLIFGKKTTTTRHHLKKALFFDCMFF